MWKQLFKVAKKIIRKKNEQNFNEKKKAESMKKSNNNSQNLNKNNRKYLSFDVLTFRFDRFWSRFMLSEHQELKRQRSSDCSDETRI